MPRSPRRWRRPSRGSPSGRTRPKGLPPNPLWKSSRTMTICFENWRRGPALGLCLLALVGLAACQSSRSVRPEGAAESEEDALDANARALFRDAVRSYEEARELGVMDWDALRAKFQA